jgi:hypothetical protein
MKRRNLKASAVLWGRRRVAAREKEEPGGDIIWKPCFSYGRDAARGRAAEHGETWIADVTD